MSKEEDKEPPKKEKKLAKIGTVKHKSDICDAPYNEVPNKVGSPLKVVFGYASKEYAAFILGLLALVFGSLANFAVPGLIGVVLDAMTQEPTDWEAINYNCTLMMILVVFSAIWVWIRGTVFNSLSDRIAKRMRYDLFFYLINKDVEFFDENKTGDILSRMSSDVGVIQDGLSTNISMFIRCTFIIIATLIILVYISWKLTLVTLGGIAPVLIFAFVNGKLQRKISKDIQTEKAVLGSISEEAISCIRTVKAFATEQFEGTRYAVTNQKTYELGKKQAIINAYVAFFWTFVMQGANGAIIYYGAVLVEKGEITVGQITAFLLYMIFLIFNFIIIGFVIANVYKVFGACDKIVEMMRIEVTVGTADGDTIPAASLEGTIEFKNVNFAYPTKPDVLVTKNISFKVDKNEVIALVGHSGCGKSSIINLIERYYNPQDGQILFSGQDIKKLDPKWYKNQIGIVSQEPSLFTGTIRENVCYGLDPNQVSDADIDEACKAANAYNFIHEVERFPEAYETLVGERGVKLSGGQKQRVAIARALIRKPRILLLDEATSALDAESEHQVQKALDELIKKGQQTVIVIAHRLSTIRDASTILVFEKGEIVERGNHADLVAQDGVYKTLVARQLTGGTTSPSKLKESSPSKIQEATPTKIQEGKPNGDIEGLPEPETLDDGN